MLTFSFCNVAHIRERINRRTLWLTTGFAHSFWFLWPIFFISAFCEQLTLRSLVFQRLCGREALWMKTLWKPRVRVKLLWRKQKWGAWNLPQASYFIIMVTPKETSLQQLEFFRTQVGNHWDNCSWELRTPSSGTLSGIWFARREQILVEPS